MTNKKNELSELEKKLKDIKIRFLEILKPDPITKYEKYLGNELDYRKIEDYTKPISNLVKQYLLLTTRQLIDRRDNFDYETHALAHLVLSVYYGSLKFSFASRMHHLERAIGAYEVSDLGKNE
ncbi:hypothetical protein J4440_02240 [Candidatus Woesearchaeota archaeon]|nr:hypothetical protein [Candidatus Woesearchaeota archaeon]